METGLLLAFLTGLAGGFGHCIGMCGPLVAASTLHGGASFRSEAERALPQILYHAGRIATYGVVGAAMGAAGSFVETAVSLAGVQNGVLLFAGVLMVLMGLGIAGAGISPRLFEPSAGPLLNAARNLRSGAPGLRSLGLGLVMGLLPCGLSYTMFVAAAGTASSLRGMATLLLFGIGTVPALALFSVVVGYLGSRSRLWVQRTGGMVVVLMGVLYIMRGLKLYAGL